MSAGSKTIGVRTVFVKKDDADRKWYVIDASGKVLGKLAVRVADYLRGKHKPVFTPNSDTGDFVVIVNAEKVKLTGKKLDQKMYYRHSGYPGGLRADSARGLMAKKPEHIVSEAVWGMLPKNRLGRQMLRKLKVYKGAEHPHAAQRPEDLSL